jgi:hypothetical protein
VQMEALLRELVGGDFIQIDAARWMASGEAG